MTSTSSVQDKIQVFINAHPEYEGRPLSEISSELVSAGVLTTEELGTLDSTSTFSIANKTPQKDDNVDSFEHAENTDPSQSTETTETIIEHGNEVILKKKGDELVEKVIKEKIPNSEEVKTTTISYIKGKPFTKKVQSGDEVIETSLYTSETLENGEEVIAIKTMNGDGKSVEQTIAKKVDENGDYTDEDFEYRKTLYLEDTTTDSNIGVKAGSVKEVGKSKTGDLIESVSDSTGEHVVTTQFNGGSVTKYDENNLYFKRQEIIDGEKVSNIADYDGKGNTYVTIRNGDGPATITKYFNDYIKKHGLDKSRQFTTADFEKLNKRALQTTGLQVGKRALVPTQYNANAPILTKRGTPQQAMNKYAQFAFEQTKERLASSTIVETTLNKTYSSYDELAREQLIAQGVHNPTNDQVNDRANELIALNVKNGKPAKLNKGAKFSVVSNQASASDVSKLKSAGLNPTFENNAFYKKFNGLNSSDKQKVMNVINACKGMKDINKVKAIVYENTGVNLYDTNLTVNEYGTTSAVGMNMREEFKQKMPLEYFLTKRMGLDLTSAKGKEVYNRMKSLSQAELDKISASQFTPEGVPNFGRSATGSIPISKNATAKDIIGTMQTQGVELRTVDEIRAERSNPRYQERQRKEQAISMLYDSVKSAYDLINDHLDELKSHMIKNAGEIAFEDLKIYGVPDVVKQLASYLSNGDGTVEGLTKSIYDKRDELQRTLFQINQLRNSKNFEADYKKLTGHDYNSKDIQAYMDMKSSLKNPVTRTIKTPKQLEQMQEQAGNMFVKLVGGDRAHEAKKFKKVGETGGSVLEMAAMIYMTGGMGELGYIKNAGSAVLKATGSRALATGVRGALTLGTYTAGRESLNVIDDFANANNLEELTIALGERKSIILEKTASSELFGFVGGATAQRIFTMSKAAQNFVSKGFSKIFGKGSEKVVSTFVADSSSGTGSAFIPSPEVVAAADKALGKGAELTGSQFISKAMMGAHSLNAVGKTASIILETLTFSGVEISEQVALKLANELFTSDSELKQAIANNTLEDYIKTKIENAPESIINTLKEQGINMLMLKAVSFAMGAHAANNMDGQYETLDKSKVYKTEINGETKVVVETTNGKLYCKSTADALTFLNQSMAVETMMKSAETTKPESEFEWAQATDVTNGDPTQKGANSDNLPVYTRANLPKNAVIMPSTNLVISTVTNKPIGRLEVKQTPVDEARTKGFTDEQIKMLEAKGLDVNAINEYMRIGLKPVSTEVAYEGAPVGVVGAAPVGVVAAAPVSAEPSVSTGSVYKPNSNPATIKRPQKEVFRINEVLTDEELSIKASDILEKVGDRYKLNKKGDEIAFKLAEQIHKVAQEAEPDIVSTIKKMGLADGERFSFRSKSVQSLHDKIQNALADSMEKGGSLTFEQALDDIRDAEGIRTIFEAKDYTSHPEVQELLQKGDREGAIRRASELQSNDTFEALKGYIDSVADGTNDVELFKMSNYMGKDGIPYFSEEQLMTLKHYAASKGVKMPIFERVTIKEEADGSRTEEKNPKATTKVRGSGYTALQANFRTKDGFIFEGQWRGPIVDPFAEAEHVPYDIRTGKDIIGVHTELTNIYKPIIESLAGENKISDVMFDEHTNYLTEYYEYSRKTELGFEDGKNPPKFPAGLDTRLRAENLLLLHEYVEKIKKEPEREAELRAEYESKLVQNTPENTKPLNKRQIDDIAEHLDLSKDGKYLDLVFEQYGKDIEKLSDVQTTEQHIELNKSLNENYSKILNKINELTKCPNPDISAKALDVLQNKVLPLAERYQQIASVVDNRASVKDGYFKKEHSTVGVLGASPTVEKLSAEEVENRLLKLKDENGSPIFAKYILPELKDVIESHGDLVLKLTEMKDLFGLYRDNPFFLEKLVVAIKDSPETGLALLKMKNPDGTNRFSALLLPDIMELRTKNPESFDAILKMKNSDGSIAVDDSKMERVLRNIDESNDKEYILSLVNEKDSQGTSRFANYFTFDALERQLDTPEKKAKFKEIYDTRTPDGRYKYSMGMVRNLYEASQRENGDYEGLKSRYDAISDYMRKNNLPIETKFEDVIEDCKTDFLKSFLLKNNEKYAVLSYDENGSNTQITFDENGNFVNKRVTENQIDTDAEIIVTNGQSSKMSISYDTDVKAFKKMVSSTKEVKDNQGNLLYTEKYVESKDASGKYNIVRTDSSGREWIVGLAEHSESGNLVIEKSLQGTDGTKTDYVYSESQKGERLSFTRITDKDGKVLLNNSQKFRVIDENHFQSVENGETYDIQFSEDKIVVKKDDGKTVELKIGDRDSKLYIDPKIVPLLKGLSGSILFDMDEFGLKEIGVGINNVQEGNAHFDTDKNIVSVSSELFNNDDVFVLIHELGHMKDKNSQEVIAENKELLDIFKSEFADFKKNQSSMEADAVSYLTSGGFGIGGIEEMVAETNAFLFSNNSSPIIEQRGQYLQQYFPKSFAKIAELLKTTTPKETTETNETSSDNTSGVVGAVPTTAEFDEVAFRETLKSYTQHKTNNIPRFTDKEVDELVDLRKKYPEVESLLNHKKGIPLQLRLDEIRYLVSYAEKKPELYNVVINNFDKLGLASATEMLESRVTDAKDIKFLEDIAGLKGLNFRGEEAPMFSGEIMSKLTLIHQKDPVFAENLVERFKVTKDQTFVMQTINKISPSLYEKANELISEKETLADGTEQYTLSSGQINMLMIVFEGSPEIAEKLKTIIQDKTIDDKVKSSFQKQLMPLLRETGVIKSIITRGGNEFALATENLNHVKNPTTPEEQLIARTGVSADFVVDKYAKKYGDNSFANFSTQTINLLNDFYRTNKDSSYVKYVDGLLEGNIDEHTVLEFLSKDDAGKKDILNDFFNTQSKINNTYFRLQSETAKQALANSKIPTNLALMKMYNPESFEKLIHSKGFKMIQQGRMNVNVLSSVRPMDKVDDNYFYNLFEAKEQNFNARYESSTALKEYDKDMLFKIIDLDPAKQDEVLNYIEKAKDPRLMKALIEKRINKIVEKQEEIDSTNSFETPDAAQKRKENAIELIRIASRSPEIINKVLKFNGTSVDALTSLAQTDLSSKLSANEKNAVYTLFNEAQQKFKNISITDVEAALKYFEKNKDFDLLKQLTSSSQDFRYSLILKSVTQNNVDLLKNALKNIGGKVSVPQLSMLEAAKDYPEMKDFRSEVAQGILQTIDEVCRNSKANVLNKIKGLKAELKSELDKIKNDETLSIEQKASASNKAFSNMYRQMSILSGEIYTETANRKGLVEIKLKDPAKYERLKESGILDMVDSGQLDSSILKHLNVNSDLTPEVYADLEAVKNGESIIPEFREGTTIPYAFSKTKVGDAVAIGDKMYINDGKSLVEWKMTKEKYLELFPPVKRFLTQQRGLGDCYFVSSLTNSMYNPQARVGIYQSFEQNGNDVSVTIKDYNEYGGTKTYKDSKIDLDNRRLHVAGAKGIQMYEQTYAKVALRDARLDVTPMSDEWNSDYSMRRIAGGYIPVAMSEIHSTGVPQRYNEVPSDFKTGSISIYQITSEKLTNLLSRFGNKNDVMIGFGTNPKPNAKAESTLDSKYNLVSSHAYIIRGYNQEKGTVIINNPHNSGTNTEVPIDVLAKHMATFDITVLGDSQTNNASIKPQSVSSVESSEISALDSAERESADETITEHRSGTKLPELTYDYFRSLKFEDPLQGKQRHRFSERESMKLSELAKEYPELVYNLVNQTHLDYSLSLQGFEIPRFDFNGVNAVLGYAKENPELVSRLLNYQNKSALSETAYTRFDLSDIKSIVNSSKVNPELVELLLENKRYSHNGVPSYKMTASDIAEIIEKAGSDKSLTKKVQSLIKRNYASYYIAANIDKARVDEVIANARKDSLAYDLEPLTSVQNQFFDMLLEVTKNSPLTIEMLTDKDFLKAIRELKPENYSKVLSFVEKFPNSVDNLDVIIDRLNQDEKTEMEEFMTSPSYMEEMKRNSAGKYQKELLEMFTPENIQGMDVFRMLRMATTKDDFLNGIKKMSKSTFKLAYDRPNQYLSDIDTKYTDPVNGKLPELEPEILEGQRKHIKNFFFRNLEDLVRILKYVDTDTVSHMMDRRTDLFEENMEKLNGISDENYELLSKALQCKSSVSGKQLSPKEKMQLTQIMYIFDIGKIDTTDLQNEVKTGSVDINNSKTTIQNAVLKAAGVDVTDSSIPAEKKQFNPEYAYLALMNQAETFENSIDSQIETLKPKMKERISLLRNDRELLKQQIEQSESMLEYVPEIMKEKNIELLDMFKTIDNYTDEEILTTMLSTINVALKYTQAITGRNSLFTVINASTTGDFKAFINDTSNKYGQANANTSQIFKDNGLDYNQWLKPSVEDVKLNVAGKDMSIRLWDRNPQEDLFMGNKTTCCTAIGTGCNAAATPLYLLNTSYNVAMLHDSKGNVVGMSRVFMTNIDGKPCLTMDNIELNKTYIKGMSAKERTQIRDGFFEYMNRYATQVTGDNNSQVYFYSGDIGDRFPTMDLEPTKKTVDFIGDFSDPQVYINANSTSWSDPKNLKDVGNITWFIVPRK